MFEQVVVGIRDDQAGRDAIALTMELAAGDGAVTLLHVQVISARPAPDSGAVGAAAKYRYAIERLTTLANECAIAARVSCVEAHSPQRGLHEFASRQHADLLVVGASDRDEVRRLLLGDDTREVLEDAPCAVAIAPAGYASRAASIRTIGVAYDRSVESERALELARTLAADHHASCPHSKRSGRPSTNAIRQTSPGRAANSLTRLAGALPPSAAFTLTPASAIPSTSCASTGSRFDLLVIGSHKFGPIDRVLEESTSQRLADEPSSPLLVLAAQ